MSGEERYEAGMQVRRDMFGKMGEERVDAASDFSRPFEDLVTNYVFGDIWNRPGLSRRDRSLITVSVLCALTKPNQMKMHIQAALTNGVTVEEIREAIMHSSVYAGIPTGVEGMRAAMEILDELGEEL